MRRQPVVDPPSTITPKQLDNVITQVREYRLITPLYGGGVNPNEADPVTVVRATEVRGQLRFWWRACRGGMFGGNAKKMWGKENEIWGKAYKKDEDPILLKETVQIIAEPLNQIGDKEILEPFKVKKDKYGKNRSGHDSNTGIPSYAAFPLQHTEKELKGQAEPPHKVVRTNIQFRLTLSFPEAWRKDVEAALWAWETFGGIGGRTRRGFGALHLVKIDGVDYTDLPSSHSVEQWINTHLVSFIEGDIFPPEVPHLSTFAQFIVTAPFIQPTIVWKVLIDKLQYFRQARAGRPGRSLWPEAETIREKTHCRDRRYKKLDHPQKFPRAAFGLPILFHFKDTYTGDPRDTTLMETSKEEQKKKDEEKQGRFASPLILRPLQCSDNRAVGLALLLEGSRVDLENLTLAEKGNGNYAVQGTLTRLEAQKVAVLNGETDVLQAFMKSLKGVRL